MKTIQIAEMILGDMMNFATRRNLEDLFNDMEKTIMDLGLTETQWKKVHSRLRHRFDDWLKFYPERISSMKEFTKNTSCWDLYPDEMDIMKKIRSQDYRRVPVNRIKVCTNEDGTTIFASIDGNQEYEVVLLEKMTRGDVMPRIHFLTKDAIDESFFHGYFPEDTTNYRGWIIAKRVDKHSEKNVTSKIPQRAY